jgi:hypothetical protein
MSRGKALEAILQDVVVRLSANIDRLQHEFFRVYFGGINVTATKRQRMLTRSQMQLAG